MPKLSTIEKEIRDFEGFNVNFLYRNGRNIRSDKKGFLPYKTAFSKKAAHSMRVTQWKQNRFEKLYPAYKVNVLYADGNTVRGNTKLGTVRETYV